ncbi:hypothetical protein NP233_g6474 [Leucocoprinus birnbaumii]|uniref:F-box domain-containing protein n=1 Tax=Leucocoprinus birnbaumii TaxID=56174 RepID=A0AAD5VT92_9AGAR|nr:hypothetical protein NP233_g6474 [Leucocoprinus birnbaumii]
MQASLEETFKRLYLAQRTQALKISFQRATSIPERAHINELPPELLAHIFGYLIQSAPEPFPFPIPGSFHRWKAVTQVCRYWRTTALSTPSLWRSVHIVKNSDEAALQCLSLSGDLPLDVFYAVDIPGVAEAEDLSTLEDRALKGVFDNIHRLRELHLFSSFAEGFSPWKYSTKPATQLVALTVISSDEDDVGSPYALPPIFNAEMTSLEKVVLANISLWPHDSFRNLKHLALYDQLDEARLPLHTFLNTLSQSPQLETLILVSAGLEDDFIFDSSNLAQPVSLPCMKYLELGDWSFDLVPLTFLKHVAIPSETDICLWNLGWEADLRDLLFPRPECNALLRQCTKINITCFLDGDHTCEADTLICVKGFTIYYYANTIPPGFSTLKSLGQFVNVTELNYCPDMRWSKYGDIIDEDLLLMLPALKILRVSKAIHPDLERLCSLLIQFEPKPKPQRRSGHQTKLPLSTSARSTRRDRNSLLARSTSSSSSHPTRPRFRIAPLLEELHITHPFDHPDFCDRTFEPYTMETLQPLLFFANVRANNGVGLKKLVMQGCHPSVEVEDLKDYFCEVEIVRKRGYEEYWEDSVGEVWERGKMPRPLPPDW